MSGNGGSHLQTKPSSSDLKNKRLSFISFFINKTVLTSYFNTLYFSQILLPSASFGYYTSAVITLNQLSEIAGFCAIKVYKLQYYLVNNNKIYLLKNTMTELIKLQKVLSSSNEQNVSRSFVFQCTKLHLTFSNSSASLLNQFSGTFSSSFTLKIM